MHEYLQVLMRMRLGDSDRVIARAGLMGRAKVSKLRQQAEAAGWLDRSVALPDDAVLCTVTGQIGPSIYSARSDVSGWSAKCCFYSRGVSSSTCPAGCRSTRCSTSTR